MKSIVCPHCNSKWESSQSVSVCPFCHKPLISDDQLKTFDSMEILLVSVRNEYGIEVFDNVPKVKGILKDKAPELKNDIKLFSRALDSSAFKGYRLQVGDSSLLPALKKSKFILMAEEFMSEENADKVLNWYRVLLDLPTIPNEQEEERRKREEDERRKRAAEVRRKREEEERRKREEEARRKREEEEARRKQAEMDRSARTLKEYEQLEKQHKKEKKSGSSGFVIFFGIVSCLGAIIAVSCLSEMSSNGFDFSSSLIFPAICGVAIFVLALVGSAHDVTKDRKIALTVIIIILIIVFAIYMYTSGTWH